MTEIYCIKCEKYKECKKPKKSYICDKTLLLSSICKKRRSEDEQIFMEEELMKILQILGLITNIEEYQKIYNRA